MGNVVLRRKPSQPASQRKEHDNFSEPSQTEATFPLYIRGAIEKNHTTTPKQTPFKPTSTTKVAKSPNTKLQRPKNPNKPSPDPKPTLSHPN